jgi:hypothetical protein
MKSEKSAGSQRVGKTPTKSDTVTLNDHAMVITVGGVRDITEGPYKGAKTFSSTKVYVGGKQVGLLSSFRLSCTSNNPIPEVHFEFLSGLKETTGLSTSLLGALAKYLEVIREKLPWASWASPGSSSPTQEVTVFDPGQINPTTPESKI